VKACEVFFAREVGRVRHGRPNVIAFERRVFVDDLLRGDLRSAGLHRPFRLFCAVGLWQQESADCPVRAHVAVLQIPPHPLDRADRIQGEMALTAVVADGSSQVQDGSILAPADDLLYLTVIDVGRAAATAFG